MYGVDGVLVQNCRVVGTQPFCYCKNLVLKNCVMENCDLSFERSVVREQVVGSRKTKIVCKEN